MANKRAVQEDERGIPLGFEEKKLISSIYWSILIANPSLSPASLSRGGRKAATRLWDSFTDGSRARTYLLAIQAFGLPLSS